MESYILFQWASWKVKIHIFSEGPMETLEFFISLLPHCIFSIQYCTFTWNVSLSSQHNYCISIFALQTVMPWACDTLQTRDPFAFSFQLCKVTQWNNRESSTADWRLLQFSFLCDTKVYNSGGQSTNVSTLVTPNFNFEVAVKSKKKKTKLQECTKWKLKATNYIFLGQYFWCVDWWTYDTRSNILLLCFLMWVSFVLSDSDIPSPFKD